MSPAQQQQQRDFHSNSKPTTSILVLGAGELGNAILAALTTHPLYNTLNPGHTTRIAVLRRASKSTSTSDARDSLPDPNIVVEILDLAASPLSKLTAIFQNYDIVIHAAGYGLPRGTLVRVAQAAVAAGVKRFFPWQFGADYDAIAGAGAGAGAEAEGDRDRGDDGPVIRSLEASGHAELFGEMLAVRRLLREHTRSGGRTGWTVVSTGLFMSFLFLKGFGVVDLRERAVRALGSWENRVTVTAVEGVGRMVAEFVYEPGETLNRVVYIAGDTVSYREVADIVEDIYGGSFEKEVWDREYLRRRLKEESEDVMVRYQNVFGAGVGVSWELERTLNNQRGIKLTTLREYMEENKDYLAASTD